MTSKMLSVVIPAYNEEDIIGECLERLCAQLDYIREILIVDNNSTDKTLKIAGGFAQRFDEVRVLHETRQGLVFARNCGLDAAVGEAIARIDSDTLVEPGWAGTIVDFLHADTENRWAALCGRGEAYGLPYGEALTRMKRRLNPLERRNVRRSGTETGPEVTARDVPVLYGSNMVLRRQTWQRIRDQVSMRRDIFEDVDTGLCVRKMGGRNAFLPNLTVGVSPRRMESSLGSFVRYMSCLPRTLLRHHEYGWAAGAIFVYLPAITVLHAGRLLIIRSYDTETDKFTFRNLLRANEDRVAP